MNDQSKGPFSYIFTAPYDRVAGAAWQAVKMAGIEIADAEFPNLSPLVRFRLPNQTVESYLTVGGQDESTDRKPNCRVFFSLSPCDEKTRWDLIVAIQRLLDVKP